MSLVDPASYSCLREFHARSICEHFLILCQQLAYLIVVVATGNAALPLISIIMLGITYGLQVSCATTRRNATFVYSLYLFRR